jgi:DNA-binding beta-propeller fold protein YncE
MKMNVNIFRGRRMAAAIALLMLTCGAPSHAWCANLWVSFDGGGGIESYKPGQLKTSGSPTPILLSKFSDASGLAFDKSHNLWAVVDDSEVVRFTAAQLKKLKNNPNPTPGVIIRATSTFSDIIGCSFDSHGNLWAVDGDNNSIDEISKAQLAAGSADITPAKVITSGDLDFPNFITFDKAGNAWVDSEDNNRIAEFSVSQLASGGSKSAAVLLNTSLCDAGEIAFDKQGNLWITGYCTENVVEFAKSQLASSGSPTPTVTLTSAIFNGPWGAVFDSKGDLVIVNYSDGTVSKFTPSQLGASGAPVPAVSELGTETENYQIIFGPAS